MKIYFYFRWRYIFTLTGLEWSLTVFQTFEFWSTFINYKITHIEKKIIYSTYQKKTNDQGKTV